MQLQLYESTMGLTWCALSAQNVASVRCAWEDGTHHLESAHQSFGFICIAMCIAKWEEHIM